MKNEQIKEITSKAIEQLIAGQARKTKDQLAASLYSWLRAVRPLLLNTKL